MDKKQIKTKNSKVFKRIVELRRSHVGGYLYKNTLQPTLFPKVTEANKGTTRRIFLQSNFGNMLIVEKKNQNPDSLVCVIKLTFLIRTKLRQNFFF